MSEAGSWRQLQQGSPGKGLEEGQGSIRAFLHSKKLDCSFIALISRATFMIRDGLERLGVRGRSVIVLKAHDVKSRVEFT